MPSISGHFHPSLGKWPQSVQSSTFIPVPSNCRRTRIYTNFLSISPLSSYPHLLNPSQSEPQQCPSAPPYCPQWALFILLSSPNKALQHTHLATRSQLSAVHAVSDVAASSRSRPSDLDGCRLAISLATLIEQSVIISPRQTRLLSSVRSPCSLSIPRHPSYIPFPFLCAGRCTRASPLSQHAERPVSFLPSLSSLPSPLGQHGCRWSPPCLSRLAGARLSHSERERNARPRSKG